MQPSDRGATDGIDPLAGGGSVGPYRTAALRTSLSMLSGAPMNRLFGISLSTFLAFGLVACGSNGGKSATDAGMTGDGGTMTMTDSGGGGTDAGMTSDSGPTGTALPTCASPAALTGEIGTPATYTVDTTTGAEGAIDLVTCGNVEGSPRAPQAVVAYTVPGTGALAVNFTTVLSGTDDTFDTVVQVRTDCATAPEDGFPPTCFDDADYDGGELRSAGGFMTTGGETVFFVLTGYTDTPAEGFTDRGALSIEITARANVAPVLTEADVRVVGSDIEFEVTGSDADMDAEGVLVRFLDGDGMPIDIDESGTADDLDRISFPFDESVAGMASFTGLFTGIDFVLALADFAPAGAELWIYDSANVLSDALTVDFRTITVLGYGEDCSVADTRCEAPLSCDTGVTDTCVAPAAVVTACAAATALDLDTLATGTLAVGDGVLMGSCSDTSGTEAIYTVTVTGAMPRDLVVTTDLDETMMTDTVLYARTTCEDEASEPDMACDDDIDGMTNPRSTVELLDVAAGTYTFVVETYEGVEGPDPEPYAIQATMRPIRNSGQSCDPDGIENRCADMPCVAATSMCP